MTQVFAVTNQKGGSGKSLLAQNLGCIFHRRNRTIVLDADLEPENPQATTAYWAAMAAKAGADIPAVTRLNGLDSTLEDIRRLAKLCDVLVVDCPPRLHGATKTALMCSSLAIAPFKPKGSGDFLALKNFLRVMREVREERNPNLKCGLVFNEVRKPAPILQQNLMRKAEELGEPVLGITYDRSTHGEAGMVGETAVTFAPKSEAAKEMLSVAAAAVSLLKEESQHGQVSAHG
ncbi:MAG: ParA family protein [Candidatus Devosia euplotis]|nr:ParA family protein [Candidatus Devosia euplotis]